MNVKRYIGAAIALLIFGLLYDWLAHGVVLSASYQMTSSLWRTPAEMTSNMPLGIFLHAVGALWITFGFTRFYKNGGTRNGLFYGFFIGVLMGLQSGASYLWMPLPSTMAWAWFFSSIIKLTIGGYIIGAIYRKKK